MTPEVADALAAVRGTGWSRLTPGERDELHRLTGGARFAFYPWRDGNPRDGWPVAVCVEGRPGCTPVMLGGRLARLPGESFEDVLAGVYVVNLSYGVDADDVDRIVDDCLAEFRRSGKIAPPLR